MQSTPAKSDITLRFTTEDSLQPLAINRHYQVQANSGWKANITYRKSTGKYVSAKSELIRTSLMTDQHDTLALKSSRSLKHFII